MKLVGVNKGRQSQNPKQNFLGPGKSFFVFSFRFPRGSGLLQETFSLTVCFRFEG